MTRKPHKCSHCGRIHGPGFNWLRCRMCGYLLNRMHEPKTWRGLVLIATAAGAKLAPDSIEAIVTGGLLLAGILGAVVPERKHPRRR